MGLLEEIRQVGAPQKPCKVARYLSAMSKEDAKDLQTALDDPTIAVSHISQVLTRNGFPVGHMSVDKHRKKVCCCVAR